MNAHTKEGLRNEANDLCYRMRNIAGTGDIVAAAQIAKDAVELLNDASAYDRLLDEDDEDHGVTLAYVLEMVHLTMDNLEGVPTGNRSRAARNAA